MLVTLLHIDHRKHVTNQILDPTYSGLWKLLAEMIFTAKTQFCVRSNVVTPLRRSDSESLKSVPHPLPPELFNNSS